MDLTNKGGILVVNTLGVVTFLVAFMSKYMELRNPITIIYKSQTFLNDRQHNNSKFKYNINYKNVKMIVNIIISNLNTILI